MITVDDLQQYRRFLKDELTPGKPRGNYLCPLCGSGSGPKATAAFHITKDQVHGKCFSCGFYGDLYDLVAQRDSCTKAEAVQYVMRRYGSGAGETNPVKKQPEVTAQKTPASFKEQVARFHAAMAGSEGERYLLGRGLTRETIDRFRLGFDARTGRVTIPYDAEGAYYDTRAISPNAYMPHGTLPGVPIPIFRADALYTGAPCFVVESPLCAVSIAQVGGQAAAISGTAGVNRLIRQLEARRPDAPLILALDNDAPGQRAQADLTPRLQGLGIACLSANVAGACKDPNELLQQDPDALRANVAAAQAEAAALSAQTGDAQLAAYVAESTLGQIGDFLEGVSAQVHTPALPTGFPLLDDFLDGGLYPGLYVVGAVSSLGKTTLLLQLADQLAASGQDVLYFSLETGRAELMAKSISRASWRLAQARKSPALARTTRDLLNADRFAALDMAGKAFFREAAAQYAADIGPHLWIIEGVGKVSVAEIRERVERHISLTGRTPVVCVDYLQLLAPVDLRASDKQIMDYNMVALKQLCRDRRLTLVAVSSLNRDSYLEPIAVTAFKESGAIEYGADVLIGLQYAGMEYAAGEADRAHDKRVRDLLARVDLDSREGRPVRIDVKVLKNRNGSRGFARPLKLHARYNTFTED